MVDDPFLDALSATVTVLDQLGIAYAITGSIASGVHGEPVPSQDVDIGIRMTREQARDLSSRLPQRFYRSAECIVDVAENGGLCNLIDTDTGLKVDLCVLASTPFYDSVMARRTLTAIGAGAPEYYVVTPEDIILMKLVWRKDTRSTKQWENALSVARVRGTRMDWKYLFAQARALDIENDLTRLRDEAGI